MLPTNMDKNTENYLKRLIEATIIANTGSVNDRGDEGEYNTDLETGVVRRDINRVKDGEAEFKNWQEYSDSQPDPELISIDGLKPEGDKKANKNRGKARSKKGGEKINESVIPGDDVQYVEYYKDYPTEKEFDVNGKKFKYVWGKYPSGKVDIAVYDLSSDMVYGHKYFTDNMLGQGEKTPNMVDTGGTFDDGTVQENKGSSKPAKGKKWKTNGVSHGDPNYRISPGTDRGDSYCARSYGINKDHNIDCRETPNKPNCLSRKKWKCKGKQSLKEMDESKMKNLLGKVYDAMQEDAFVVPKDLNDFFFRFLLKKGYIDWDQPEPDTIIAWFNEKGMAISKDEFLELYDEFLEPSQDPYAEHEKSMMRNNQLPEATTVAGMGGYGAFGYDAPAFFAVKSKKKKKKLTENVKLPLNGEYLYTNEGVKVTPEMVNEWFDEVKGDEKPSYNGGKLVQIDSKCQTFPYCSQGAVDKPLKLIGETEDEMDSDSWEYVKEIAEAAKTKPERIAKIIRETYLKRYE